MVARLPWPAPSDSDAAADQECGEQDHDRHRDAPAARKARMISPGIRARIGRKERRLDSPRSSLARGDTLAGGMAEARSELLRTLAQRVADALPPAIVEEVVLTGSVSRGAADEVSDIEMLVVTRGPLELEQC